MSASRYVPSVMAADIRAVRFVFTVSFVSQLQLTMLFFRHLLAEFMPVVHARPKL
jgi:hypothetical protein